MSRVIGTIVPTLKPIAHWREVWACDVTAGDTVRDEVYGNVWTVTGTDGRLMSAVNDDGHGCTMRVHYGDRMYILMPLP